MQLFASDVIEYVIAFKLLIILFGHVNELMEYLFLLV